ncbi:BglG family transcription antiterminator [Streptococcus koreensis]|uniref:BglG family transcription antiterminator n=1 Tax=Streptococcus koreensis TaxID=2382163 RepID=UPI003CF43735
MNVSSTKEKNILQFLIKHKERFVTSKELAEHLSCSDRTVRNTLKLIDQTMNVQGVKLISKQGQGYQLFFENQEAYQEFRLTYELGEVYSTTSISKGDDRLAFILNKLLFEQVPVLFDDLADELYVSRSTLSHDFKKIRRMLSEYDLSIESRANKGVYVSGEERYKRCFIMDYFLSNQFFKTLHCHVQSNFFDQTLSLEEIARIVLEECQDAKLKLSDFVLQNLVVHIALAIVRIKSGFEIKNLSCQMSNNDTERKVAKKILARISEVSNQEFPVQEIDYITLHLLAKSQLSQETQTKISKEEMKRSLVQTFQALGLDDIYHFSSDFQLFEGLITHLMTLQIRLDSRITLNNPLVDEVKKNYSDIFFMTKEILENMETFSQVSISDDEIAYVSLHFLAAIERRKENDKFSVLAICASGFGAAQMLRNRLEAEFGNRLEVVDVIGYYELNQEKIQGIDFIVSAVDLSNLYFQVPVFTVSVFLKNDEIAQIREAMDQMQVSNHTKSSQINRSASDVKRYFSKDNFLIWFNQDKKSLLSNMADVLSEGESYNFKDSLLHGIQQREELSSVVFSEKIAVPHPIQALGTEVKIAVAICKDPLLWDDQNSNVQLVFLLSPSIYGNEGLTDVTKRIVSLTEKEDLQNQLIACNNFEDFMKIFENVT